MEPLVLTFDAPNTLMLVAGTAVVAGAVRGFSGFGGPAIMLLVLNQFYAPATVVATVLAIDMIASLKLLAEARKEVDWRNVGALALTTVVSLPFGLYALYHIPPDTAARVVAMLVALSTVAMLAGIRFRSILPTWSWAAFGLLAGTVVGMSGIALLGMVFLFSMPGQAAVSRANAMVWLFLCTPFALLAHGVGGSLDLDSLVRAALMGLIYTGAAVVGARFFRRANEQRFRRFVGVLLLVLSMLALVR